MKPKILIMVAGYACGLLVVGWLRTRTGSEGTAGALAGYATPIYVAISILAAVRFIRAGMPLRRLGFESDMRVSTILALAIGGVAALQLLGAALGPLFEHFFGAERDLTRFAAVEGSVSRLIAVLALSWTVAAFGEEIAFRILLMRGLAYALGNGRFAHGFALVAQAAIFGLVHAYQGPAGIAGAATSGLVFGALTLAARGTIWPAALAHGFNNTIGLFSLYSL